MGIRDKKSGARWAKDPAVKRSLAYPIYDFALVATLLLPLPIAISAADASLSKALGYATALIGIWLLAALAAVVSRITPAQYIRSLRRCH